MGLANISTERLCSDVHMIHHWPYPAPTTDFVHNRSICCKSERLEFQISIRQQAPDLQTLSSSWWVFPWAPILVLVATQMVEPGSRWMIGFAVKVAAVWDNMTQLTTFVGDLHILQTALASPNHLFICLGPAKPSDPPYN